MSVYDWRTGRWDRPARPCIHCGMPTHLRDDDRQPSHKVCAEESAR